MPEMFVAVANKDNDTACWVTSPDCWCANHPNHTYQTGKVEMLMLFLILSITLSHNLLKVSLAAISCLQNYTKYHTCI